MKKFDPSKYPGLAGFQTPVEADPNLYHRIGARIASARTAGRMTQDELGMLIGESAISISRWENASRKPNVEDLEKLARVLNISILFFTQENETVEEDELKLLNRAVGKLQKADREEMLAIANIKLERQKRTMLVEQIEQFDKLHDKASRDHSEED